MHALNRVVNHVAIHTILAVGCELSGHVLDSLIVHWNIVAIGAFKTPAKLLVC